MKNRIRIILFAGLVTLGLTGLVRGEETKTVFGDFFKKADVQITGATAFYSKYMWRGFRLDDDYVLQPSININAFKGWNLNVWGNYDTDNSADSVNSNETDTTISYTHKLEGLRLLGADLKPVSVTVGHIYYDFSGANTFAKEAFLGFGYETLLSPTLTWYHDYSRESQGGGDGDYLMLNLAHSLTVIKDYGMTLDLSGHVGYNKHSYIRGEGGDVLLTSGVTVPLTKSLKMSPTVNYSIPFGGLADSDDGNKDNEFFWGVTLAYNF
ncbi:MAG TPA: hypothetical protein PL155_03080 [Candidatus Omnitrophota bacterium]|nr:hypothetical protein [Candidatus Omnitrophota bacterium]HPD84534.1 hypothetical protein [Candidatus Omnitrophota bacterium]HRZ03392.1 hypothetical protein [Candidatus Omnitrophota bacterium]